MAKLNTHVHVVNPKGEPVVLKPGVDVPAWAEKAITNPKVWVDGPKADKAPQGDGGAGDSVYADLKAADLKAEIERRNADRDDDAKITPAGKKNADLIAALEADDAAHDEGDDSGDGGE